MPIVLDANVAVDWFLPNMKSVASTALDLVVAEGSVVPARWRWEVQDVLRRLQLAGKPTQSVDFVRAELRELPIDVDDESTSMFGDEAAVSARFGISVYEAAYLELVLRRHVPIATNDRDLAAAVKKAKLPPVRSTSG